MQPKIELLNQELIDRILEEAFQLMMKHWHWTLSRQSAQAGTS